MSDAANAIVLGLPSHGKTTCVQFLRGKQPGETYPTTQPASFHLTHSRVPIRLLDTPRHWSRQGTAHLVKVLKRYAIHVIIFVVDVSDDERLADARKVLRTVAEASMSAIPGRVVPICVCYHSIGNATQTVCAQTVKALLHIDMLTSGGSSALSGHNQFGSSRGLADGDVRHLSNTTASFDASQANDLRSASSSESRGTQALNSSSGDTRDFRTSLLRSLSFRASFRRSMSPQRHRTGEAALRPEIVVLPWSFDFEFEGFPNSPSASRGRGMNRSGRGGGTSPTQNRRDPVGLQSPVCGPLGAPPSHNHDRDSSVSNTSMASDGPVNTPPAITMRTMILDRVASVVKDGRVVLLNRLRWTTVIGDVIQVALVGGTCVWLWSRVMPRFKAWSFIVQAMSAVPMLRNVVSGAEK